MIRISGLSFRYRASEKNALSDITLEIPDGDFLGIIGSSGAGKSTLTYALSGVVPHHYRGDFYGKVEVNGLDTVTSDPETLARYVGSVFQDIEGQLLASVVEDEILFGLENFGTPRDEIESRIEGALATVGASDLRNRMISGLSGGQKQKVAIAAIMALKPRILALDEPTGELDPKSSRNIFETLRELNEKHGVTVVVVEQKVMTLCEFANRLAVMNDGRLVIEGPVREVLRRADELENAGVNIPRVATLARRLRERGLYHGEVPRDLPEAAVMMKEALGRVPGGEPLC
jgi:energy-coupling factor transport system ATP-binding protein